MFSRSWHIYESQNFVHYLTFLIKSNNIYVLTCFDIGKKNAKIKKWRYLQYYTEITLYAFFTLKFLENPREIWKNKIENSHLSKNENRREIRILNHNSLNRSKKRPIRWSSCTENTKIGRFLSDTIVRLCHRRVQRPLIIIVLIDAFGELRFFFCHRFETVIKKS